MKNGRAALNGKRGLGCLGSNLLPCVINQAWRSRDLPVMACRRIEERAFIF
jgi:hypothetical protein